MGYWLGIDVGSTVTTAAVCRAEGLAEVAVLGSGSAVVPSVVFLGEHEQVEVGEAALRRAVADPDRLVRGFTGRIGDQVPMVVGGRAYTATQLAATLISWVVDQVSTQQGGPAEGIVVTHPATWGDYKREVLATSLAAAGLGQVRFCAEPEAVAAGYAAGQPIASGHTIAVYDLGGTTFDATVIRSTGAGGFTALGQPQVLDQLGGVDFDDAVFGHVLAAVPGLTELDADDPTTLAAIAALRRECSRAVQALSADTEVTIPVIAPGIQTQVRLHRAEFDDMIRPQLSDTLQALRRTLHTAQLQPHQLDAVLLVGGSCRIPLVAQLVSTDLDQPVIIDADPATVIARGAAALAVPTPRVDDIADAHPVLAHPVPAQPAGPTRQPERPSLTAIPLDVEPAQSQQRRATSRRMKRVALAGSLALLAAAASVPLFIPRSDSIAQAVAGTKAPRTPSTAATAGNTPLPTAGPTGSTLAVPVAAPNPSASDAASAGTHPVHTAGLQTAGASTAVPVNNSAGGRATTSPAGGGSATPTAGGGGTTSAGDGGGTTPTGGGGTTSTGGGGTTSTGGGGGTTSTGGGGGTTPTGGGGTTSTGGGGTTSTGGGGTTSTGGGGGTTPTGGSGGTTSTGGGGTTSTGSGGSTPTGGGGGTTSTGGGSGTTSAGGGGTTSTPPDPAGQAAT